MWKVAISDYVIDRPKPLWIADSAFGLAKLLWPDPKQRPRAQALIDEAKSIWLEEGATQPLGEATTWLAAWGG
jgi:hypothetical protein